MNRKVSFHTLGCKLNFSETSTIARQFETGGFVRAAKGEPSDICVINTCSVTENADKKCRNLIRKLIRLNPGAIIAVTGCYAQLKPADVAAIEGVDLVVGNDTKEMLFDRVVSLTGKSGTHIHGCQSGELTGFFAAFSSSDRTRAFLKVQDGCSYKCSYCTIPYARGASRNIPVAQIVAEAGKIAASGVQEIVITGINTGDFGRTTGETFHDLIRALDTVEGIQRYRISSIEPNLLNDEVISFTASSPRFMPHFHIPLQSGCDRILGLMRRRYNTAFFRERIDAVRNAFDDPFIGVDVIVGFPGETEADFEETYRFIESIEPSYLHIFPYSERPGTPAAAFAGKVAPVIISERVARLGALNEKLYARYSQGFCGTEALVLYESSVRKGKVTGFTENYIKVATPYYRTLVNSIVRVRLGRLAADGSVEAQVIR